MKIEICGEVYGREEKEWEKIETPKEILKIIKNDKTKNNMDRERYFKKAK